MDERDSKDKRAVPQGERVNDRQRIQGLEAQTRSIRSSARSFQRLQTISSSISSLGQTVFQIFLSIPALPYSRSGNLEGTKSKLFYMLGILWLKILLLITYPTEDFELTNTRPVNSRKRLKEM